MYEHKPDLTDEDIGIRAHKVKRDKAVERAVELIRHGIGDGWRELSDDEVDDLRYILGELWALVTRAEWDELRFGQLALADVIKALTLASQLKRHARPSTEILRDLEQAIRAKGVATSVIEDEEAPE